MRRGDVWLGGTVAFSLGVAHDHLGLKILGVALWFLSVVVGRSGEAQA